MSDNYSKSLEDGTENVTIVRCKDCKWFPIIPKNWNRDSFLLEWPGTYENKCPCRCPDDYYSWVPEDNWYCGNGEKKEEMEEKKK